MLTRKQGENVFGGWHFQYHVKDFGGRSSIKYVRHKDNIGVLADGSELLNPETVTGLVVLHAERYGRKYEVYSRL